MFRLQGREAEANPQTRDGNQKDVCYQDHVEQTEHVAVVVTACMSYVVLVCLHSDVRSTIFWKHY